MENVLVLSVLTIVTVLWIEAHERRAATEPVRALPVVRMIAKTAGWLLAGLALWLVAAQQGWERGIPVWLAWFSLAAMIGLGFAALFPKKHCYVGVAALAATMVLGAVQLIGAWI